MAVNKFNLLVLVFITAVFYSCTSKTDTDKEPKTEKSIALPQKVEATIIKQGIFTSQILCNGIIKAENKADLFFETQGIISKINVQNGSKVHKGEVLAVLKNSEQLLVLEKAREMRNQAMTELSSLLIGYGGKEGDTTSVSPALLQNLKSQSGYTMALLNLQSARMEYENTFLKAPFTGVVANLKKQPNNRVDNSKPFCAILNNKRFVVDFNVMEQDLPKLKTGQQIQVLPIVSEINSYTGFITQINPMVDKNGLINVKALVNNKIPENGFKLLSGMNVNIIIENIKQGSLVIPKSALILRSDKKVVFTYENGKSKWNYVETGAENSSSYLIIKGLKSGDTVIVNGALNLAHDADVQLTNLR